MKRAILLAYLLVVLATTSSIAQRPEDSELNRLAKVDMFAFGHVGYAGVISPGEKDFETILRRASATQDFEMLYKVGNPQGRAYALVGLKRVHSARFSEFAARSANSKEIVETISGCIVSHESFSDVVSRIKSGNYDQH